MIFSKSGNLSQTQKLCEAYTLLDTYTGVGLVGLSASDIG